MSENSSLRGSEARIRHCEIPVIATTPSLAQLRHCEGAKRPKQSHHLALNGIASASSKPRNDVELSNDVKLNGIASAFSKPRNDRGFDEIASLRSQ